MLKTPEPPAAYTSYMFVPAILIIVPAPPIPPIAFPPLPPPPNIP